MKIPLKKMRIGNKAEKALIASLLLMLSVLNGVARAEDITIERTSSTGHYLDEEVLKNALLENYRVEGVRFSIETESQASNSGSRPATRSIYTAMLAIDDHSFQNENAMWELFSKIIPTILWLSADCRKAETLKIEAGPAEKLTRDGNNSSFSTSRTYELSLQKLLDHQTQTTVKRQGTDEPFFSAGYE